MLLLKIIFSIFIIVIILVVVLALMSIIHHLWVLHNIKCKYCGHKMHSRGLVEQGGENKYMFQCPHCGAWEYIAVTDIVNGKEGGSDGKGV